MTRLTSILVWLSLFGTNAFQSADVSNRHRVGSVITGTVLHESQCNIEQNDSLQARRSFLSKIAVVPLVALPSLSVTPAPAEASGGATAGGAYLLSAKKRYYERVKTSVKGLLSAVEELKNGNSKVAKEYFSSEDDGSWKDLTAAGYLLSNAFRRSSSTAPDSLPAVKVSASNGMKLFPTEG